MDVECDEDGLDTWAALLTLDYDRIDRRPGARRVTDEGGATFLTAVAPATNAAAYLHLSTTLLDACEPAGIREWVLGMNGDLSLNRLTAYQDGVLAVETKLLLPSHAGASPSAAALFSSAATQQLQIRDFLHAAGPEELLAAVALGLPLLSQADHVVPDAAQWAAHLSRAAHDRLGVTLSSHADPGGEPAIWTHDDGDLSCGVLLWAACVQHNLYGACIDRLIMLQLPAARQYGEILGGISSVGRADVSGAGAWTVGPGGRLFHRLTVPLQVIQEGLIHGDDAAWIFDWIFDTVQAEVANIAPWVVEPEGGLASLRHLQAQARRERA